MLKSFTGEHTNKVDGKGRVSIPAEFRRMLAEGDPDTANGTAPRFKIVYGLAEDEGTLQAYTIEEAAKIERKIEAMPYGDARSYFEQIMTTMATIAQLDDTGRIVLPAKFRSMINVRDEVTFAGKQGMFEIWEPSAYIAKRSAILAKRASLGVKNPMELLNPVREGGE